VLLSELSLNDVEGCHKVVVLAETGRQVRALWSIADWTACGSSERLGGWPLPWLRRPAGRLDVLIWGRNAVRRRAPGSRSEGCGTVG
jgi:hypothetical protein